MAGNEKMDINQERALQMALNGHNLLITGFPGTGKSHIIARIADELIKQGKSVKVTASTGKASQVLQEKLNKKLMCTTIHKFTGIKDGRYTNDELISKFNTDETLIQLKNNICSTDCLIIDEISMISLKVFEQIEFVLSQLHKRSPFGGLQIILCGDFFQLPPVPNISYGDEGAYCFLSNLFSCFHHVQLDTVHRQSEPDFIEAIHQVARGSTTSETINLLKRLKRNLIPGPRPIKLFALNLDVDLYNSECLIIDMEGDIKTFEAQDSGDRDRLINIRAPKLLAEKKGCPVILIMNINDELVNGLTGEVHNTTDDSIEIYFSTINRYVSIERYPFTVYDCHKKIDVACRMQFPIRLAFALTVHRSQGITVDRAIIDCNQMNQFGQLAVALSRCREKKGLQVLHFSLRLLRQPPKSIYNFYSKPQFLPKLDLSCCKDNPLQCSFSDFDINELFTPFEDDTGESVTDDESSNDVEDEAMANFMEALEESENDNYTYELPASVDIVQLVHSIQNRYTESEQQILENKVLKEMETSIFTRNLVSYLWDSFFTLKEQYLSRKEPTDVIDNKTLTEFYRQVNIILTGNKLKNLSSVFIGDVVARKNVIFKLASEIRKLVLESAALPVKQQAEAEANAEKGADFPESDGGRGKIRYLGGWCISKVRKKKINAIYKLLYKPNKRNVVHRLSTQINALRQLTDTESYLTEHSTDKPSLAETARRQNLRVGLTNIADKAQEFFLMLDRKIRSVETTANLTFYGTNFDIFMNSKLETDNTLLRKWESMFIPDTVDEEIGKSLLQEIFSKYCLMSLNQLRKSFLGEIKAKKKLKRTGNKLK